MTDFKSDFNLFDDDDSYYEESTPQLTKTRQQPGTLHFAYSPLIINERRSSSLPPEPSQDRRSNSLEDQRRGYDHPFTITDQEELLSRMREDLINVDLASIKGPLRDLCLESQGSVQNKKSSPQSPILSNIQSENQLRRTVSPQEAFLDYEAVDSKLPKGGSLFAPMPTPFKVPEIRGYSLPPLPATSVNSPRRAVHPFALPTNVVAWSDKDSNVAETDEESTRESYRESSFEDEIETPPELFKVKSFTDSLEYDYDYGSAQIYESNTRTVLEDNEPCDLPNFVQTAISYKGPAPSRGGSRSRSVTPYLQSERSTFNGDSPAFEEEQEEPEMYQRKVKVEREENGGSDDDDYQPEVVEDSRASPGPSDDEIRPSTTNRKRSRTPALISDDSDDDASFTSGSPPPRRSNTSTQQKRRKKSSSSTISGPIKCTFVKASGTVCGTAFRRPYDLARHLTTIHGDKNTPKWSCVTCNGSFSRKDALIRHARIRNHSSGV